MICVVVSVRFLLIFVVRIIDVWLPIRRTPPPPCIRRTSKWPWIASEPNSVTGGTDGSDLPWFSRTNWKTAAERLPPSSSLKYKFNYPVITYFWWGVDGRMEYNNDNRRDLLEMIRLEFVDLLSVIQSSAPSCSSPWRRKPSIHWHSKSLLAVDPASTTCGTVNPLSFGHQKGMFPWIFYFGLTVTHHLNVLNYDQWRQDVNRTVFE